MTRKEAEEQIMQKMKEIVELYHAYNPRGRYLSMSYNMNCLSVHNEHWAADNGRQINCFQVLDWNGVMQL